MSEAASAPAAGTIGRGGARLLRNRWLVLDVAGHPRPEAYVASGSGGRAQWYRNVVAEPRVRFETIHENALGAAVSEHDAELPAVEPRLDGAGS